ncbi:hypothetical protein ANHYDRO_00427 [Anaerococcus hydrogenalis DSM 7454]|uniref:Uncharacterized protein n=1 Tax=Anaerococcus hydrogenalis DSM 7454 TaxID=561177 RepID=B6W781_9FIRM|nr:hypothetical protein [Anaerococcus hydrogenalis]EEB36624.1 hypothetical protein ANHYDRO_00427 [Anaerococcus hydrogenalis DSM 7454]
MRNKKNDKKLEDALKNLDEKILDSKIRVGLFRLYGLIASERRQSMNVDNNLFK